MPDPENSQPWSQSHFSVSPTGTITVYFEILMDMNDPSLVLVDEVIRTITNGWTDILNGVNAEEPFKSKPLSLALVFTGNTDMQASKLLPNPASVYSVPIDGSATISARYLAAPPGGTKPFVLQVGHGKNADAATRLAKISYVKPYERKGYLYWQKPPDKAAPGSSVIPALVHELGHIFGLSDRYYDALYWIRPSANSKEISDGVRMTCKDIRTDNLWDSNGNLRTDPVADGPPPSDTISDVTHPDSLSKYYSARARPRYAERRTLAMAKVVNDANHKPGKNLMSSSSKTITPLQANIIASGKVQEIVYRKNGWVAVLGAYYRPPGKDANGDFFSYTPANPNDETQKIYAAWEADSGTLTGLLFNDGNGVQHRYPCVSSTGPGRDGNVVLSEDLLKLAKGKSTKRVFWSNVFEDDLDAAMKPEPHDTQQTSTSQPSTSQAKTPPPRRVVLLKMTEDKQMCYCARLLNDLVNGANSE